MFIEVYEYVRFVFISGELLNKCRLADAPCPLYQNCRFPVLSTLPFKKTVVNLPFEYPCHMLLFDVREQMYLIYLNYQNVFW